MSEERVKRLQGKPAPDCPQCGVALIGFYELGGTRAICPKCRRQGPNKSDFEAACRAYLKQYGGKQSGGKA